jgi:hypothetical protein
LGRNAPQWHGGNIVALTQSLRDHLAAETLQRFRYYKPGSAPPSRAERQAEIARLVRGG